MTSEVSKPRLEGAQPSFPLFRDDDRQLHLDVIKQIACFNPREDLSSVSKGFYLICSLRDAKIIEALNERGIFFSGMNPDSFVKEFDGLSCGSSHLLRALLNRLDTEKYRYPLLKILASIGDLENIIKLEEKGITFGRFERGSALEHAAIAGLFQNSIEVEPCLRLLNVITEK